METPVQTCARLLGALEDLIGQETASLAARDFAAIRLIQQRAAPLVDYVGTHGPAVAKTHPAIRTRVTAVLARRQQNLATLGAQIAETRQRLDETRQSQVRVARIGPAYGRATTAAIPRQLRAIF